MYVEMTVYGFTIDSVSQRPVVLLKDTEGANTVPLWISLKDGVSIAADLLCRDLANKEGRSDFLDSLLKKLELSLSRVIVDMDDGGDIVAHVCLSASGNEEVVAVGLAEALNVVLSRKLPLMVSSRLIDWATRYALNDEVVLSENNERRYADFLENLDPSQMNKLPI
ncbi:bifunctional nuclease family protein [Geobacter pelophilus]|uniref:Bifunctional nuclease family protein n=1 Tax=Geoanaerobacter pelophilus TaxID=60036 RepID=A0AAW4L550_9BACT|nr:bifunctional nuclease domain-containing protein [Geoanaerobacter pelophilus]MBT0663174.1 bifunctional nuclease family protein [Geoanaerobacter pelophilus]